MIDMETRIKAVEDAQHETELANVRIEGKIDLVLSRFDDMVLRVEFTPVRYIVFGGVWIIVATVIASMLGLVMVKNG